MGETGIGILNSPSDGPCEGKQPVKTTAELAIVNIKKAVNRLVNIANPFMVCIPTHIIVISYDELAGFYDESGKRERPSLFCWQLLGARPISQRFAKPFTLLNCFESPPLSKSSPETG